REAVTVVLAKHWHNGELNSVADLSVTSGIPDPMTPRSPISTLSPYTTLYPSNQASAAVQTGDQVTVTETLPGANTGSYDTILVWNNRASPYAAGTCTLTAATSATRVTCTFSNNPQRATVVL